MAVTTIFSGTLGTFAVSNISASVRFRQLLPLKPPATYILLSIYSAKAKLLYESISSFFSQVFLSGLYSSTRFEELVVPPPITYIVSFIVTAFCPDCLVFTPPFIIHVSVTGSYSSTVVEYTLDDFCPPIIYIFPFTFVIA